MIKSATYLTLLFFCSLCAAQDSIFRVDGTRSAIIGESVKLDLRHNRLTYIIKGGTETQKLSLKNLNKVSYRGKRFQMLKVGSKLKGYFVLAEHDGITLATLTKDIVTNTGGFNTPYIYHEVLILNGGKIVERVSFTENNDDKNIKKRVKAKQLIALYFGDCIEVSERLAYFANNANGSLIEGDVAAYLKQAPYLLCP
jgi:hypothetical protein